MKLNNLILSAAIAAALGMISAPAVFASDHGKGKETEKVESGHAGNHNEKHDTDKHHESNSKDDKGKLKSEKHDQDSKDSDSKDSDESETESESSVLDSL
jgi:stringent starvation protein B